VGFLVHILPAVVAQLQQLNILLLQAVVVAVRRLVAAEARGDI
jgi:hypothetical protein